MERRGRAAQDGSHVVRIFAVLDGECNDGLAADVALRSLGEHRDDLLGATRGPDAAEAALDGEELLDWIRDRHVEEGDDASVVISLGRRGGRVSVIRARCYTLQATAHPQDGGR